MTAFSFGEITAKRFRRTLQPVRRNSFDIEDKRAKVSRPIGDGDKKSAFRWIDMAVSAIREWDNHVKEPGKRHRLGAAAIWLYELLLLQFADFKTGRCDPCLDTLQKRTGWARATVVSALARLREEGFLGWQRRTERTGNPPGEGPQVRQISNAYFFGTERWPKGALRGLTSRLGQAAAGIRKIVSGVERIVESAAQRAMARTGMAAWQRATGFADPVMVEQLAQFAARVEATTASSESSLNPPSSIKYKRSDSG